MQNADMDKSSQKQVIIHTRVRILGSTEGK